MLPENIDEIRRRFAYVFDKLSPKAKGFYYKPCLIPNEINGSFKVKNLYFSFSKMSRLWIINGFRINNLRLLFGRF